MSEQPTRPRQSVRRRVAGVVLVAVAVAVGPAVLAGRSMIDTLEEEIRAGQLRLADLSATQADRILMEAFTGIEQIAAEVVRQPDLSAETVEYNSFDGIAGPASLTRSLQVIGPDAEVLVSERRIAGSPEIPAAVLDFAGSSEGRAVSQPWVDPVGGRALVALSVPIYGATGSRLATIVGVLDLTEPLITDLIQPVAALGASGHADLVDERGTVLASTQPDHVLNPGDHPHFYAQMAQQRRAAVDRVAHNPGQADLDRSEWHIMAYAPLESAPWGVAMGASEPEVLHSVRSLQRRLILLGTAGLAALLTGAVLAIRLSDQGQGNERHAQAGHTID